MVRADPAITALGAVAGYNLVQNFTVPDALYVPANLGAAAGFVAFGKRSGLSLDMMGLGKSQIGSGLTAGSVAAGAIGMGLRQVAGRPRLRHRMLDERARGDSPAGAVYRAAVRFPLGTALFEEVVFRGVIDGLWRRRGHKAAWLASAMAFGAWHLVPTYRDFPKMAVTRSPTVGKRVLAALGGAVVTGLSSVGFTMLRERSGSVLAPWLAHTAFNTGSYLLARHAWTVHQFTASDIDDGRRTRPQPPPAQSATT